MSNPTRSHTRPDLAAPEIAEGRVKKRKRCYVPFLPDCIHPDPRKFYLAGRFNDSCLSVQEMIISMVVGAERETWS